MSGNLAWTSLSRPKPGETCCGDQCLVRRTKDGVMVAVIDGAGHGAEAQEVAELAAQVVARSACSSPIPVIQACHRALERSRGVVMSIVAVSGQGLMTWIGAGNVQGRLVRADGGLTALLVRPGMVGRGDLPQFRPVPVRLEENDLLVLVTDGICGNFEQWIDPNLDPGQIAANILDHNRNVDDDALVFVARYEEQVA